MNNPNECRASKKDKLTSSLNNTLWRDSHRAPGSMLRLRLRHGERVRDDYVYI